MTALLTPEQIEGMKKRDAKAHTHDSVSASQIDRRALLREREAIAERLEAMTKHARQYLPDLCDSVCRDDHYQREFMGNHGAKGGSAFAAIKSVIEGAEELITAIRGEK